MTMTDVISVADELDDSCAEWALESLGEFMEKVAYEGFSPEAVKKALRRKEPNAQTLRNDVFMIILFVLYRGTKVKKTNKEGLAIMTTLTRKYGIVSTPPKDSNTLTMSRVVAAHPIYCLTAMRHPNLGLTVDENACGGLLRVLRFTGSAAIIPKKRPDVFEAYLQWSKSFDVIINPNRADPKKVEQYASIMWNSRAYTEEERTILLAKVSEPSFLS